MLADRSGRQWFIIVVRVVTGPMRVVGGLRDLCVQQPEAAAAVGVHVRRGQVVRGKSVS
jgi:hypothetical protein